MSTLTAIPDLVRIENCSRPETMAMMREMTRPKWDHEEIFGRYCSLSDHIDAPPREVYEYMADPRSLVEWTLTLRRLTETDEPGLWAGEEMLCDDSSKIYVRTLANPEAMTVDYHCAWDQGEHLWMIYLLRVVDAELVLNRPGSVVLWTNCRHPFYQENPWPDLAASPNRPWVGEFWDLFYAAHWVELQNLKKICEHRHSHGQPIAPEWSKEDA
ncbi:SRPBCC family protein [Saccharopolyspora hattusasensis]|uniref:SRPBCC family protein n=1 Tax=Saccharopolyspora hattusasensis TaxID=1128679 RepID=UPI003D95DFFC